MKKLTVLCASILVSMQYALAQADSIAAETLELVEEQKGIDWSAVGQWCIDTAIGLAALAIIAHMIYEYFIKKPHQALNVDECKEARKNQGLKGMSDAEANELIQKMDDILDTWTSYKNENGEDMWIMTKYSQTKKTLALLDEVVAANPDREDVVNRYNELNDCYNDAMKRQYNGSTKYIILCVIIAVLLAWMSSSWSLLIFFALQIAIYWLASMTPTYLLNKKALKESSGGGSGFMSGMIAGLLGFAASAQAVTTVTKWSDGSTTKDTDHSNIWISWLITIILLVVLAIFMFVVALMNYLRNYILHI